MEPGPVHAPPVIGCDGLWTGEAGGDPRATLGFVILFLNQLLILDIFQSLEMLRELYNKYSSLSLFINSYFTIFTPYVFLLIILKSSCRYHDTSHLNISSCIPKYSDHTHETLTYCII